MIVDQRYGTDHAGIGLFGSLFHEVVPDQIAKSLGSVGVTLPGNVPVELLQQVGIDGYSNAAQLCHVVNRVADPRGFGQAGLHLTIVNDFCTCGAQLPEEARFCHKCGKPQGELLEPEIDETPVLVEAPPPPAEAPAGVNWKNPMAVRVAFLAGALTALVIIMPLPPVLQLLWQMIMLLCGGFFAVWLYNRRTGAHVNLRSGAYLGWTAGLFCFLIMLIMFTISILAISAGEGLRQSFRELIAARGNTQLAEQFDALLQSPSGVAVMLLGMLVTSFLMVTVLPTIGGALGAKVFDRE